MSSGQIDKTVMTKHLSLFLYAVMMHVIMCVLFISVANIFLVKPIMNQIISQYFNKS